MEKDVPHPSKLTTNLFPPPSVFGLEDKRVEIEKGVFLHYVQKLGYRAKRQRDVVVYIHGFPDDWRTWQMLLPHLSAVRHHIFVDLRGFGQSSDDFKNWTYDTFAEDIIKFMDELKIKRASIVGFSMGSIVARNVAIKCPDRVTNLVLISSTPASSKSQLLESLGSLSDLPELNEEFMSQFQNSTIANIDKIPKWFFDTIVYAGSNTSMTGFKKGIQFLQEDKDQDLSAVTTPTLILWGNLDQIFPLSMQEDLKQKISNNNFVSFECGHSIPWEEPELVAFEIYKFCKRKRESKPSAFAYITTLTIAAVIMGISLVYFRQK